MPAKLSAIALLPLRPSGKEENGTITLWGFAELDIWFHNTVSKMRYDLVFISRRESNLILIAYY